MTSNVDMIQEMIAACNAEEQVTILKYIRTKHNLHVLESTFGAPAELILEAIHRAPELTRRMMRGVIADAAFAKLTVPQLHSQGWRDVTKEGNFAYDHKLADDVGEITIQVKLQRSKKLKHVVTTGAEFGLAKDYFMVECQRTRGGSRKDNAGEKKKTRPYSFGDFDILAVSLQPSTRKWDNFLYSVGSWLMPGKEKNEIATYQPVSMSPNEDWTDDFVTVAKWFREKRTKINAGKLP